MPDAAEIGTCLKQANTKTSLPQTIELLEATESGTNDQCIEYLVTCG